MSPETFAAHRAHLLAVAYRMLGSVADAEDIVQEAAIRALRHDARHPRAFLTTMVTRMAIDRLRSAQRRREVYVGPWLPEPLPTPAPSDLERAEALSLACLRLLETLDPAQRAAFLLREVFDYAYADVAAVLERSEAASRKLVSRARAKLAGPLPTAAPPAEHTEVVQRLFVAISAGEPASIERLFTEEAVFISDGGGRVSAALQPIVGARKITRFFLGLARVAGKRYRPRWTRLNGRDALLVYEGDAVASAMTFDVHEGRIAGVQAVRNPAKLAHLAHLAHAAP